MKKQTIYIFTIVLLTFTCAKLQAQKDICKNIYVWDFEASKESDTLNFLAKQFTDIFESKLSKLIHCKVLDRRDFSKREAQLQNEEEILSLKKLSKELLDSLKLTTAEKVAFGKIMPDIFNSELILHISINDIRTSQIFSELEDLSFDDIRNTDNRKKAIDTVLEKLAIRNINTLELLKKELNTAKIEVLTLIYKNNKLYDSLKIESTNLLEKISHLEIKIKNGKINSKEILSKEVKEIQKKIDVLKKKLDNLKKEREKIPIPSSKVSEKNKEKELKKKITRLKQRNEIENELRNKLPPFKKEIQLYEKKVKKLKEKVPIITDVDIVIDFNYLKNNYSFNQYQNFEKELVKSFKIMIGKVKNPTGYTKIIYGQNIGIQNSDKYLQVSFAKYPNSKKKSILNCELFFVCNERTQSSRILFDLRRNGRVFWEKFIFLLQQFIYQKC